MSNLRRGVTLAEVMVALIVGTIVLGTAQRVGSVIHDAARRIERERAGHDREQNARRWLKEAFETIQVGQDSADSFVGTGAEMTFTSLARTSQGWPEPRRLMLRVEAGALKAVGQEDSVVLMGGLAGVEFAYLLHAGEYPDWVHGWRSPATAPIAIRMTFAPVDSARAGWAWWFVIGGRG